MSNEELSTWAAKLLGWKQGRDDRWRLPGTLSCGLPDFCHDLNACRPLLKRMGNRCLFYWHSLRKRWACEVWASREDGTMYFHSPESEPGGCIILAAQYMFGKERDAKDG